MHVFNFILIFETKIIENYEKLVGLLGPVPDYLLEQGSHHKALAKKDEADETTISL